MLAAWPEIRNFERLTKQRKQNKLNKNSGVKPKEVVRTLAIN